MKDNFGVSGRPHGGNASYVDEMRALLTGGVLLYVGGHRAQQIAAEGVFPLCGRPELNDVLKQLFVAHCAGGARQTLCDIISVTLLAQVDPLCHRDHH